MKFADHLDKETIQKFNQLRHTSKNKKERDDKQTKEKKKEKLSHKDILELMGTSRDTYKRVGGAVRRR